MTSEPGDASLHHVVGRGVQGAWPETTIMPRHLKNLVHARMEKTGESYQRALEHVRAQERREPTLPRDAARRASG